MKPLYLVLIGAVILIIGFFIYKSNKTRKEAAEAAAAAAAVQQNQSGPLSPGGSSQVAQIIGSLFPYFQTATESGLIGKK